MEKSAIDFGNYGIEKEHLLSGESDVTYKEMEFVMKLNPSTQVLSINLKQEITSSKHSGNICGLPNYMSLYNSCLTCTV